MTFMTKDVWPNDGRKRSHIPLTPVWIGFIRVLQLITSVAILAVTVYGLTTMQKATNYRRITTFSGSEGFPFSWFTFAWTFAYLAWLGVAIVYIPVMYNRWVQLGLEVTTVIFWFIAMSLLASHADDLDSLDAFIVTFGPKYEAYYEMNVETYARSFVIATFTATALAALNLLLWGATLVHFGRALHAIRKVKLESAAAKLDEVAQYYGHAPRRTPELYNQTSHQNLTEPDSQGYSYDATELYGRDPRYNTAEMEAAERRVELA
ncbi:hypothetical protein CPLU01_06629 [Colletotrichum plurivorum]|uniref:MARVEL domain-containing protein n=1 Tax=Colletotrichum plurivorum TaxID=2175906 RepID=A0A8H6NGD0_9PEZI|nr:hypothetical protein CPLU01_06629 [Colletotrichum plurivorum]